MLPSIAQVEYRLGEASHLLTTSLLTPVTDFLTRLYAVVTFRLPLPHGLIQPFLTPVVTHIFRQDSRILAMQTKTIRRFGGEQFASTEIDVLGPSILRLLLQAQRGEQPPKDAPPEEHRLRMRV
ncbi:MAG TPA: aromatic ring-hydroxylating dioxygenase subunit alpha, partial [Myxococcaceae bacterium]|nr:aromatic ring-hydroxylating dioxygenase subunit alpha [Myxococcaceae bacterium]